MIKLFKQLENQTSLHIHMIHTKSDKNWSTFISSISPDSLTLPSKNITFNVNNKDFVKDHLSCLHKKTFEKLGFFIRFFYS